VPTWLIGPVLGLLGRLAPSIARWAEIGDDPRLVVRLEHPVDKARGPNLEWLHLTVVNEGLRRASRTRTAREVHATVTIRGRPGRYRLLWSNVGAFGQSLPRVDIARNIGQDLPIALRAAHMPGLQPLILGTLAEAGVCYLTEANFLTQHSAEVPLPPGIHELEVSLQYGDGEVPKPACFRLTIPPPEVPLRLSLTEIDCGEPTQLAGLGRAVGLANVAGP